MLAASRRKRRLGAYRVLESLGLQNGAFAEGNARKRKMKNRECAVSKARQKVSRGVENVTAKKLAQKSRARIGATFSRKEFIGEGKGVRTNGDANVDTVSQ